MSTTLTGVPAAELAEIRSFGRPLRRNGDLDPLLERVDTARFVLLGEASHGTAEYYGWRAAITQRLIAEHGFSFVAVEGDWPDCFRLNRWVKDRADQDRTARDVLGEFERWPTWMWANEEVAEFVEWLREHNRGTHQNVGFYGLDVYSLWDSMHAVLSYLGTNQPDALAAAHQAYRCFEPYAEDPQRYAWATRMVPTSCEDEVVDLLIELRRRAARLDGDPEAALDSLQNAEVLAGAERYYRTMVRADHESWNVRDCHMADTLDRLVAHHGPTTKAVVWEHNTHIGDARATDMARAGMVNVGQLVRERHRLEGVLLVGFGGHRGSVIAADEWGGTIRRLPVPAAPQGTHEQLLHDAWGAPGLFVFPARPAGTWLRTRRGHRAIGVVYQPGRDHYGNWVPTVLGHRYDAFCYFEETSALHPLQAEVSQAHAEQETYPWNQ
jgi:erythromycin esterase